MENVKTFMQKWIAIMTILVMVLGQYAITGFLAVLGIIVERNDKFVVFIVFIITP